MERNHTQELRFPNLVKMLRSRAEQSPNRSGFNFLVDGEGEESFLTYSDLDHQARIIAAKLQSLGAYGERVLLLYAPGLEYITAFFACLYAGAVAVPTYPPDVTRLDRSLPRFLSIVTSSKAKFALTTSPIFQMAQFLLTQYPELHQIEWLLSDELVSTVSDKEIHTSPDWQMPEINLKSLAFIQYTSGSTAVPKGVMLTHGNLLHNIKIIGEGFDIVEDEDIAVFWLPFYHDMGLIGGVIAPIYYGVKNTLISPLDFLQRPIRWLRAISKYRATISGGPNFAYDLCVRKYKPEYKDELDLSCWQLAFNGAEPIRAGTFDRFANTFSECGFQKKAFYPCYGLAEATVYVSGVNRSEFPLVESFDAAKLALGVVEPVISNVAGSADLDLDTRTLVGCGREQSGHHVEIVDPDTLLPCAVDVQGTSTIGEIWVSGPSIAEGYWELPAESQRTFHAKLNNDPDTRYMRTGDLGFIRAGQLFIAGRLKDLIIIDGLNHYPQDIELTVESCHPAIRPGCSAAFSVEINDREQIVVVAELAKSGKMKELLDDSNVNLTPKSVQSAIRNSVTKNHDLRLHDVILLKPGTVPKTSSGKIQRHACKNGYLDGTLEEWVN